MDIPWYVAQEREKSARCFRKVFQAEGRYVNDHCFIEREGSMHLFYIDGEVGKGPYDLGNEVVIGHAVSKDLVHWSSLEPALVRDPGLPHEERGVFAPYIFEANGVYYMYYSSHNMPGAQYMNLAVSNDLLAWERHPGNPLFFPKGDWADWVENVPCSCRDAHVWYDEDHRMYALAWVGDLRGPKDQSCIALSVSRDLLTWEEAGPVLARKHSKLESLRMKTESPCVIKKDGLYYLFYRHGFGFLLSQLCSCRGSVRLERGMVYLQLFSKAG